jgi:hypothetical protein
MLCEEPRNTVLTKYLAGAWRVMASGVLRSCCKYRAMASSFWQSLVASQSTTQRTTQSQNFWIHEAPSPTSSCPRSQAAKNTFKIDEEVHREAIAQMLMQQRSRIQITTADSDIKEVKHCRDGVRAGQTIPLTEAAKNHTASLSMHGCFNYRIDTPGLCASDTEVTEPANEKTSLSYRRSWKGRCHTGKHRFKDRMLSGIDGAVRYWQCST